MEFEPQRVYSPTAPNRPRFHSASCRGLAYRAAKIRAIDQELSRAQKAIERAREVLQGGGEEKT